VDRNNQSKMKQVHQRAAPHAGAWIETGVFSAFHQS